MSNSDACAKPGLMPFQQALNLLLEKVTVNGHPLNTEKRPLAQADNRVLAQDIIAPIDVPPFNNSAMDGFALRAEDLTQFESLTLVATALAGTPFTGTIEKGECVRIMTGAVLPAGTDSVEMQENTELNNHHSDTTSIVFRQSVKSGQFVRQQGQDIVSGSQVLPKGQLLGSADIGLLASLGLTEVEVFEPLKVAIFSSGDEIIQPGHALDAGQIYDTNRYTLNALLNKLPVSIKDYGCIKDTPEAVRKALLLADKSADVIITSGGVSVGEADYIKPVVDELGTLELWKVAIKPGKPFAYGRLANAQFFGLPGNPVSALVTMYKLVLPALQQLMGMSKQSSMQCRAITTTPLKKSIGRLDFQRGVYHIDEDGQCQVTVTGNQNSAVLTSVSKANCFIVLPAEQGDVSAGETVTIEPFDHLL